MLIQQPLTLEMAIICIKDTGQFRLKQKKIYIMHTVLQRQKK